MAKNNEALGLLSIGDEVRADLAVIFQEAGCVSVVLSSTLLLWAKPKGQAISPSGHHLQAGSLHLC